MFITVKYQVEGFHNWPGAIEHEESYLTHLHRHMFHFTVGLEVRHHDREVEFIGLRRELLLFTEQQQFTALATSCEQLVAEIIEYLQVNYKSRQCFVWVEEDGENGAFDFR